MKIQQRPTVGDASESGIIKFFEPIAEIRGTREKQPVAIGHANHALEIPFNSTIKYRLSIHVPSSDGVPGHENEHLILMKGAPEQVWEKCDKVYINGQEIGLSTDIFKSIEEANHLLGANGERVLAFSYKYISDKDTANGVSDLDPHHLDDHMSGFTFIGLMALQDPPRDRVPEAVTSCLSAGIKVIMVTGDQPVTAEAIAKQVNIITKKSSVAIQEETGCSPFEAFKQAEAVVVHGKELTEICAKDDVLPEEEQGQELATLLRKPEVVFARTSPAQKLIIVEGCQKLKHIVAVTGDGVNDSPAIKKADIGIAMGLVGTDVAKDAADMILLNDDFSSIVDGVEEGRLIFDNLKKSIAYTLSSNIPEIGPFISFITFQLPLPLSTVMILCVDLGTDMVPAISLAYEQPELDIMRRRPRNAQVDHLVNSRLISFSYLQIGII
jgi:sodium/potassium-transporting ATPase subunit alpha